MEGEAGAGRHSVAELRKRIDAAIRTGYSSGMQGADSVILFQRMDFGPAYSPNASAGAASR
jgi:hypothetical protein